MTDESGGIGWSAPEMLGEIVRANPFEYCDLVPLIWHCQDEDLFRAGALWGLYRLRRPAGNMLFRSLRSWISWLKTPIRRFGGMLHCCRRGRRPGKGPFFRNC